jgi:hypothetical protein
LVTRSKVGIREDVMITIGTDAMTTVIVATIGVATIVIMVILIVIAVRAARDMTSARKESRTTGETETITTGGGATTASALFPIAATMSVAETEAAHRAAVGMMLGMTMAGNTGMGQTLGMAALNRKVRKPSTKS